MSKQQRLEASEVIESLLPFVKIDNQKWEERRCGRKRHLVEMRCPACHESYWVSASHLRRVNKNVKASPYCSNCAGRALWKLLKPQEVRGEWREYVDFSEQKIGDLDGKRKTKTMYVLVRCMLCGKKVWKRASNLRLGRRPICTPCAQEHYQGAHGSESPNWNGGHSATIDGYALLHAKELIPDEDWWLVKDMMTNRKYVREHRYVVAKKLGRPLTDNEVVRHLNGIKDDNRPENLVVGSREENYSDHDTARKRSMYWHNVADVFAKRLRELGENPESLLVKSGIDTRFVRETT